MNDSSINNSSQILNLLNFLFSYKLSIISLGLLISAIGTAIIFYDYVVQTESKYLIAPVTIKMANNKEVPVETLINMNTISRAVQESNLDLSPSEVLKNVSLINSSILVDPLLSDLNFNSSQYIKENLANRFSLDEVSLRLQDIKSNHFKVIMNIDKLNTGEFDEKVLITNIIKNMNIEASTIFDFTQSGLKKIDVISDSYLLNKNFLFSLYNTYKSISDVINLLEIKYSNFATEINQYNLNNRRDIIQNDILNRIVMFNDLYNYILQKSLLEKNQLVENYDYLSRLFNQIDRRSIINNSEINLKSVEERVTLDGNSINYLVDMGKELQLLGLKEEFIKEMKILAEEITMIEKDLSQLESKKLFSVNDNLTDPFYNIEDLISNFNDLIIITNQYSEIVRDTRLASSSIELFSPIYVNKTNLIDRRQIILFILNIMISFSISILYFSIRFFITSETKNSQLIS
tara:strand:+ start:1241 stop:2626 length:1386 start_codon:yes stop_codon:yes gene_type:complete